MAVLGRVLFSSAERVDLPDLLSIDSYSAGDWKYFIQSIVGSSKPYILTGFDVINPDTAIGLPTCSIRVADSVVYYPGSAAGPFYHGLPEGHANAEPLIPQLRTNAVNYVYLTLSTFNTASDTRALWDPDRNGGAGAEFTQDINTESVIQAQVNVSTGSFPVNTIPVAIITMGPSAILSIQDARDMLFRLGTGGLNPNPLNGYAFSNLPSSTYARSEPSTTISNISDPNPFQGGDKNITTLKGWMDLVMTKLKELGGTKYWYEATDTFNLISIFNDVLTTTWKSKGSYTHSSATPGELSWSEDIYVKSANSPRDLVIRATGGTPLNVNNEQVAFIELVRNQPINTLDTPVAFTNGQAYINTIGGSVGLFQNLKKGDWIKKATDADVLFLQVREFYNTTQSPGPVAGSPTSAANARSVVLSGAYQGSTSQPTGDIARFDRGEYLATDIQVVDRDDSILTDTGGNLMWFATRSDTVMAISSITTTTVSGTVTVADGNSVTVSATAHGLVDGDRIDVSAPASQAGTYSVEVVDANTFVFHNTDTASGAFTGTYAIATTTSRSIDGFQIESANHGLESGETVLISDTTNFDGDYDVNVRSATQFQFPIGTAHATETSGVMTLARMDVRSEEGINKLIQGETIDIGSNTTDNIRSFIGMSSPDEVAPTYLLPASYNTFHGGANYNGAVNDNLSTRVAKNTAMLMNKAQDKTVQFVTNATEAVNQAGDLWFAPPTSTLTIVQPGSVGNATITLPEYGSAMQLDIGQCAYVTINRNATTTPGVIFANIADVPVDENVFVIATRYDGDTIYLWDSSPVQVGSRPIAPVDAPLAQVYFYDPVSTVLPTGTVTIDGETVSAGMTVLFTNLSAGANNAVFEAIGVGTNITGWSAKYFFHGWQNPTEGDTVLIINGSAFAKQIGKWDGFNWLFNDKVRYFNGTDYWEQSNLITATLPDAAIDTLFEVAWAGSEHMILDYSIVRSTVRETGTMRIVTDGATASVSTEASYLNGNAGVSFEATVDGPNLVVSFTCTPTGDDAVMKYMVRRWSASPGGPGGIASYSGAPLVPTAAAGSTGSIQFNSGGALAANPNFQIDTVDLSMNYNGLRQGVLSSAITILDNQSTWANLFTMDSTYPYIVIDYSISKETFARVGRILVAYDGTNVTSNDSYIETGVTGVTLQAVMSGSNIQFQYQSTDGAGDGTFKYSWRKWA